VLCGCRINVSDPFSGSLIFLSSRISLVAGSISVDLTSSSGKQLQVQLEFVLYTYALRMKKHFFLSLLNYLPGFTKIDSWFRNYNAESGIHTEVLQYTEMGVISFFLNIDI
jgi:hypothetical protein